MEHSSRSIVSAGGYSGTIKIQRGHNGNGGHNGTCLAFLYITERRDTTGRNIRVLRETSPFCTLSVMFHCVQRSILSTMISIVPLYPHAEMFELVHSFMLAVQLYSVFYCSIVSACGHNGMTVVCRYVHSGMEPPPTKIISEYTLIAT